MLVIFRPGIELSPLLKLFKSLAFHRKNVGKLINFYEKINLNKPIIIYMYLTGLENSTRPLANGDEEILVDE